MTEMGPRKDAVEAEGEGMGLRFKIEDSRFGKTEVGNGIEQRAWTIGPLSLGDMGFLTEDFELEAMAYGKLPTKAFYIIADLCKMACRYLTTRGESFVSLK